MPSFLSLVAARLGARSKAPSRRRLASLESLEGRQLLHGGPGLDVHPHESMPVEVGEARPGRAAKAAAARGGSIRVTGNAAVSGSWTKPTPFKPKGARGQYLATHLNLLPDGRVLAWPHDYRYFLSARQAATSTPDILVWDPATNGYGRMNLPRTNVFCSGQAFLADGRLLVVGGNGPSAYGKAGGPQAYGHNSTEIYDYRTDRWTASQPMDDGRYYASSITLGNGEVLAVSGNTQYGRANTAIEVWKEGRGWRTLKGATTRGYPDWYPHLYLLSDGRVFAANPGARTFFIDPSGEGKLTDGPRMNYPRRYYGTSAMYDEDKILTIGGNAAPATAGTGGNELITSSAEVIDLKAANPTWTYTSPMRFPRFFPNATILPDGQVLVTGGTREQTNRNGNALRGAVMNAELWDPATGRWTTLAKMKVPRLYHSTALLLPDGRVMVSGGGQPESTGEPKGTVHQDMQIFSPPYLFRGPRPTIASAPATAAYGSTIAVTSPDAASVARVTLVRLGTVTHFFNMNQRIVKPSFTRDGDTLSVTITANANSAPPGDYMLSLINDKGVPSVSKMIRIGA